MAAAVGQPGREVVALLGPSLVADDRLDLRQRLAGWRFRGCIGRHAFYPPYAGLEPLPPKGLEQAAGQVKGPEATATS